MSHDDPRRLKADAVTFATGRPGVFGTGDVRIGAATVVDALDGLIVRLPENQH